MVALICAVMVGAYLTHSLYLPPGEAIPEVETSSPTAGVWSFGSLAFDLITTLSTMVYLFRVRKDLTANHGILMVVWQVLWCSAVPPLALAAIVIVDGYMIPGSSRVAGVIASGMMGKIFVLSLMINIVGQGHIRRQFERRWTTPSPPTEMRFQKRTNQTHQPDWPSVHVTASARPNN
ncbi:unnamed protein product [Rhizoctonia solani]|uniref:Uncharacterized protein n=1 Tax=Rhizoctonia solani TaxID=456999 RepID=A0A8H2WMV7_9AGAM|nr:unnamed protein product [Rhizoctonia solani]